jgi:hypothetical protein
MKTLRPFSMAYWKVDPAEGERGGEDGDVAFAEGIHGAFEGVEAEESVVAHFNVAADFRVACEAGERGVEFVFKDVSHGDEFGAAFLDRRGRLWRRRRRVRRSR